jgi:AraC-like DNA-binding protein
MLVHPHTGPVHPHTGSVRVAAVARAIESMRAGLAGPRPLAELARTARYSPFHFHRIFREVTGVTPARFLAALRMAEARRLLVHSPLTVTEISRRVGYESPSTFTTQFGRLLGIAPHGFRRLMRALCDVTVGALLPALPRPAGGPGEGRTTGRCVLALAGDANRPALVVGGLRPAGGLGERPGWWVATTGTTRLRLPVHPQPGDYSAVAVVVPARTRLTDAFVDEVPGSYLLGVARLRLPSDQDLAAIRVPLRGPRPTDPPMVAAAPVRWLTARCRHW